MDVISTLFLCFQIEIKNRNIRYQKGGAAMYGMASTVPEDICKDLAGAFLAEVGTVGGKLRSSSYERSGSVGES